MTLDAEIRAWDAKSKAAISEIFERHGRNPGFLEAIVRGLGDPTMEIGASWLLKHHFDKGGNPLDAALVEAVCSSMPRLRHWEARLHILQCLEKLAIPERQAQSVERFIRRCLGDEVKFVRAWAFSGFHELAVRFPQYRPEAERILHRALETETAGSVLSRVRRKIKKGF